MEKARILVVEDERIVSMDIQARLGALGYDVVDAATSGEEAIRKADTHRPDLVLMDIMLDGDMDGIEAAETIRRQFGTAVIFLTAYADSKTLDRAKITEPFGYILKPFEERELHGHVEIALHKHRMELQLKESEGRYALATEGANDGIWEWDLRAKKMYFSPRWKLMLGYGEDEIGDDPKEWFSRLHTSDRARVKDALSQHVKGNSPHFETEYRILCKDASYRWMLTRGMASRSSSGKPNRLAGSQTDITERKIYDPITTLPNRTLFMDRVEAALDAGRSSDPSFAVLSVHLNDLGATVDGLGGKNRDELLGRIARRLQAVVRPGDTVARLEEDSFGIVLTEVENVGAATVAARSLQQALAEPLDLDGQEVYVHASIGIALGERGYADAAEVVRDAGTAMRRAAVTRGSHFEVFDEEMRLRMTDRIKWEADLRRAREREELEVYYQPIVTLETGRLVGFEALVRWRHRDGLLLPKDFIPLAEESELIFEIERFVMQESLEQVRRWKEKAAFRFPLSVSVNLSAKHYAEADLTTYIESLLEATGVEHDYLKLEITETALLDDNSIVTATLTKLDELSIQLVMDDFGTGYSSLSYLHQFPITTLKIDRSFVSELGVRADSTKIVQTIINLAKSLEIGVTAEGVETVDQISALRAFGCIYAQGSAFSRPLPASEATELLVNDPTWLSAADDDLTTVFS